MGTPEFAVASLDALIMAGCNVIAVVTAPDKPAGRGMQMQQSAVKQYAVEKGIRVLQPSRLKDPDFHHDLRELNPDLQVVVAFRMLPEVVWNLPPLGTINVHGSLLPKYRGAAPINWAVINGEKETGVTTFKLQHEIDTGNILMRASLPIAGDETAGSVHDRMKVLGADLLVNTVKGLAAGTLKEVPQNNADPASLQHAPKIFTETCRINWNLPVDRIYDLVRGLSPYPAAFTELDGKKLKIFSSEKEFAIHTDVPGTMQTDHRSWIKFAAADGYLQLSEIQLEGKKKMNVADFLRGYRFGQNTQNK